MTREEIIKCIFNDNGQYSCPSGYCRVSCMRCAENQLAEYEQAIREEAISEIKSSLSQAGYEYDENMSIDNNIGSAMLGEFADGYNKGRVKCEEVRKKTIDECEDALLMAITDMWIGSEVCKAVEDKKTQMHTANIYDDLEETIKTVLKKIKDRKNEIKTTFL